MISTLSSLYLYSWGEDSYLICQWRVSGIEGGAGITLIMFNHPSSRYTAPADHSTSSASLFFPGSPAGLLTLSSDWERDQLRSSHDMFCAQKGAFFKKRKCDVKKTKPRKILNSQLRPVCFLTEESDGLL